MDNPFAIQLASRTIFWEDMVTTISPKVSFTLSSQPEERRKISAEFWDQYVEGWFKVAIKHDYNVHDAGIWFADGREALYFLARWKDRIPF